MSCSNRLLSCVACGALWLVVAYTESEEPHAPSAHAQRVLGLCTESSVHAQRVLGLCICLATSSHQIANPHLHVWCGLESDVAYHHNLQSHWMYTCCSIGSCERERESEWEGMQGGARE